MSQDDALHRSLRLLRQFEEALGRRIGTPTPTVVTREINTRTRDGSAASERAIELARQAVTVVGVEDDDLLRNRVLSEIATEVSNNPEVLGHYVAEAAYMTSVLAAFAARLGPDDETSQTVIQSMIATIDEDRRSST